MSVPSKFAGSEPVWDRGADSRAHGRRDDDPYTETDGLDLVGILSSVEETAYAWNFHTGLIDWESNACAILGIGNPEQIATSAGYHALIAPEHLNARLEAFARTPGVDRARGAPYRLQYRLRPGGLRSSLTVRVEDQGRWWPDQDGHPKHARGVIRIVPDHYLEQQRFLLRDDHDELTGQLNRTRLMEALRTVLARAERERKSSAFLMVAVNNLAVINDTFGLEAGDETITEVARRIREKLRGGDILGRFASNKFGIVMMDCGPAGIRAAAERYIKSVSGSVIASSRGQLSATVSIGGVLVPDEASSVQQALDHAMRALELAKSKRLDCFILYEPGVVAERNRTRSRAIGESVITAIDEHRMRLALQPMIGARSGMAEIYECLLRLERPDGGLVAPGEFVPVAEHLGLSRMIDRRAIELAIDLLAKHSEIVLSVNVSGLTSSDQEWISVLRRLVGRRTELYRRLIVEITETAVIEDINQSIVFVDTLKELGCRVAIDDFGAGYTSFKNLKLLNVDILKIDGTFVKNLANDTSDQIFIKTMIDLATSFGMETVAEWVGDEQTVNLLCAAGVTYMQGYHFGMPLDAADYQPAGPSPSIANANAA